MVRIIIQYLSNAASYKLKRFLAKALFYGSFLRKNHELLIHTIMNKKRMDKRTFK